MGYTSSELPNFRIPHAEKIDWMIETKGWALEPVPANLACHPPSPGYSYTIGLPAFLGFPEIVVSGLTPVAISGLLDLVVEQLASGVVMPIDAELVGLLDNDLRCIFASVDVESMRDMFRTGVTWHRGVTFPMVQLLWPDRDGWLPHESGFDPSLRSSQRVIGRMPGGD